MFNKSFCQTITAYIKEVIISVTLGKKVTLDHVVIIQNILETCKSNAAKQHLFDFNYVYNEQLECDFRDRSF